MQDSYDIYSYFFVTILYLCSHKNHSNLKNYTFSNHYKNMAVSYQQAGVNLEAGYEVVSRIKKHVSSTSRLGVMGNIGAFGGMFDLSA